MMLRVLVLTANHAEQRPRNERRKAVLHEKHGHLAWAHTHTHTLVTCAPNNLPKVAKVPAGSITKVHRSNQKMQSLRE